MCGKCRGEEAEVVVSLGDGLVGGTVGHGHACK